MYPCYNGFPSSPRITTPLDVSQNQYGGRVLMTAEKTNLRPTPRDHDFVFSPLENTVREAQ